MQLHQTKMVLWGLSPRTPEPHDGVVTDPSSMTYTVLIADDDLQLRTALGDLIQRRAGLRLVAAVEDGRAAGVAAAQHRPDVAVVDVRMPVGGIDAIRAVRSTSPGTAVVVFSAFADPVLEQQLLAAGATTFAVKGDRNTDIIRTIEAAASTTTRK